MKMRFVDRGRKRKKNNYNWGLRPGSANSIKSFEQCL
jgi:hypothetical protein